MPAENRKRVVFLITTLGIGGAEVQVLRLAQELNARGWHTSVVALRGASDMVPAFERAGVAVSSLTQVGERFGPVVALRLARLIRTVEPDVLVTFLLQANVLGRLIGAWCRIPVVSSIRNTRFGGGSRIGGVVADFLERATTHLARAVVVNSRLAAEELLGRRVVHRNSVLVIPNALPERSGSLERDERNHIRTLLLPQGPDRETPFIWLAVGRLELQKNYVDLIKAFALLIQSKPSARLVIAGEGTLRHELETLISDLQLDRYVALLGLRNDVGTLLLASDAFVLASRWEGLPNVVLEALSSGTPTVATPVGGVPELIADGMTGWLSRSPEPDDLEVAMRAVMSESDAVRASIGLRGQAEIQHRYSVGPVTDAWQAAILVALRGKGDRRQ